MRYHGHLPFEGEIIWLTPEQGGRSSGPPPMSGENDYAAVAFVPPRTVESGLASFVVRVEDAQAWRSRAFAAWPILENSGDQSVELGTVIVVTEASRPVAFFRVDHVWADPLPTALRALDLVSLLGCTEDDARDQIEAAGGILRTFDEDNSALTTDIVPRRVTARVESGKVVEVRGFCRLTDVRGGRSHC